MDRRRITEIQDGMTAARRRGVHCGRQKTAFDRDRAVQLHLQGKSIREIAALLHVSRDTIARLLQLVRAPGPSGAKGNLS